MNGARGRLLAKLETLDDERIQEVLDEILDSEPGSRIDGEDEGELESEGSSDSRGARKKRDLEVVVELVVTARTMAGKPFSRSTFKGETYHQTGYALSCVHRKAVEFTDSLVDLGFESAKLHGEGPQA